MLYKAVRNHMADDLGLMISKGDVFSDEKKVMKDYIAKNPELFKKYKEPEEQPKPKKVTTKPQVKPAGKKGKKKNEKPVYDADFDASANPGVIAEFAPVDGEPHKIDSRDLPDAKGDIY